MPDGSPPGGGEAGSLQSLVGRCYGPFRFRLAAEKVAEYAQAAGERPERWTEYAPPSYAGAALFVAAPSFLNDPQAAAAARMLIHGEQTFRWPAPWPVDARVVARGRVERIRERGGVAFASFAMEAEDEGGRPLLSSKSTFLMSGERPPGGGAAERPPPAPEARRENALPVPHPLPGPGGSFPPLPKSASRADLVRYAAAAADFNPVHWDHRRAVESGVGGVICHGLLLAAWAMQPAAASVRRPDPLAGARFRFRAPLPPDVGARVESSVAERSGGTAEVKASVVSEAGEHVSAVLRLREDP